jgi:hypothetical protein
MAHKRSVPPIVVAGRRTVEEREQDRLRQVSRHQGFATSRAGRLDTTAVPEPTGGEQEISEAVGKWAMNQMLINVAAMRFADRFQLPGSRWRLQGWCRRNPPSPPLRCPLLRHADGSGWPSDLRPRSGDPDDGTPKDRLMVAAIGVEQKATASLGLSITTENAAPRRAGVINLVGAVDQRRQSRGRSHRCQALSRRSAELGRAARTSLSGPTPAKATHYGAVPVHAGSVLRAAGLDMPTRPRS